MKRILFLLLLLSLFCALYCVSAAADSSGSLTGTISWTLTDDGGLTLTGTGATPDYELWGDGKSPFSWDGTIKSITVGEGITHLGGRIFHSCEGVTSITLPNSLQSIGDRAFYNNGITSVSIPGGVTAIGESAFCYCEGLKEVYVWNSSTAVGEFAFDHCASNLTLYGWENSTAQTWAQTAGISFQSMGSPTGPCGINLTYTFDLATYTLTISGTGPMESFKNVGFVPWYYFKEHIRAVVIGQGVTTISQYAFQNALMTSITIPDSMTFIGHNAFYYSIFLTGIVLPENVARVEDRAFIGCLKMTSAVFLNPDTSIGMENFTSCTQLTIKGWEGSTAENHAEDMGIPFEPLVPKSTLILPAGLTTIEENAFSGVKAGAVLIPASVTTIVGDPFEGSCVVYIYGTPNTAASLFAIQTGRIFVALGE